jgi:hypothetical protein
MEWSLSVLAVLALAFPLVSGILQVQSSRGARTRDGFLFGYAEEGDQRLGVMMTIGNDNEALFCEHDNIKQLRLRIAHESPSPFFLLPRPDIEAVIFRSEQRNALVYDRFFQRNLHQLMQRFPEGDVFGKMLSLSLSLAQALWSLHRLGFALGGVEPTKVVVDTSTFTVLLEDFSTLLDLKSDVISAQRKATARAVDLTTFGSVLGQLVNLQSVPLHLMAVWESSIPSLCAQMGLSVPPNEASK